MKHILYITTALFLSIQGLTTLAQNDSTLSLSLQQAVDLGLKQRFDIKNQELSVQISQSNTAKTLSKNLPQVAASVDFRYNAVLPTSLLPPGFIQGRNDYTPVKFGTPYNTLTSITATQNIFNSNVSGDKLVNKAQEEYDQVSLEKYKTDAKANITQSYYQVLLNKEQITLTQENIKNSEEIVRKGSSEYANGTLLKTDFNRYELDLLNAQNQLKTAQRNYDNSIIYLKAQLALDPNTNIILTDALEQLITESGTVAPGDFNVEQRYEYKMEKSLLRINDIQAKKLNRSYLPSVYLYGNASIQNQSPDFALFNTNNWYPYSFVGFHADIPIFDGFDKSRGITGYKLKSMQNQNNLEKLKYDMYYESLNTQKQLTDAYDQYKTSKDNYLLAKTIMELDQVRYKEGTITFAALKNTENSLQTAQTNYINSVYNVLVAQVNYKKAKGEL